MEYTVSQLAKKVRGELIGRSLTIITGLGSLESAREGDIAFVKDETYAKSAGDTRASALIVPREIKEFDGPQIICENPYLAFIAIANLFTEEKEKPVVGVHKTAVIRKTAKLGRKVAIGAHVYVEFRWLFRAASLIFLLTSSVKR